MTIYDSRIHDNDSGLMSSTNGSIVAERVEIEGNGADAGLSHNIYVAGESFDDPVQPHPRLPGGQNVKSRADYTELLTTTSHSADGEVGLVDDAETAAANSNALLLGNVIVSKPRGSDQNQGKFIDFGQDTGGSHDGTLYAGQQHADRRAGAINFLRATAADSRIVATNNIFFGSDSISGGGVISGANNWVSSTANVPAGFANTSPGDRTAVCRPGQRQLSAHGLVDLA